ncbi:MAG: type II secretion system F family protein [Clostridiales bacterium]|nr:type II secretion system F family protein [Clostridiales bacterium]
MIDYSVYTPERQERLRYYGLYMAGAAMLGILFYNHFIASALLALTAVPAERYYRALLAARRRRELSAAFKDMLLSLSSSFQTGRHMTEALREAKDNLLLIYPKNAAINRELEQMTRRLSAGGESEREVLFDFARRSCNEDVQNFADVYYTCLTTGGDIVKVVHRTADALVEKIAIRREIEALTAQKQYESKLLTAMPLVILLFLRFSAPDYLDALYGTLAGRLLMTGALAALVASFVWSNRILSMEM